MTDLPNPVDNISAQSRQIARDQDRVISVAAARRCRASSARDIPVWTMGQMLIVVNKESCMLLLQRRAEPRKRLHLYQPCAKRKHTWNLWPFHRRSPLLPATIDLSSRPSLRALRQTAILSSVVARCRMRRCLKAGDRSIGALDLITRGWIYADRVLQHAAFKLRVRDNGKKSRRRILSECWKGNGKKFR